MRVDEGKELLNRSRDEQCKKRTIVGKGKKGAVCDPGSELRRGRSRTKKGEDN